MASLKISCGARHSGALEKLGRCLTSGCNLRGQLGRRLGATTVIPRTRGKLFKKRRHSGNGDHHSSFPINRKSRNHTASLGAGGFPRLARACPRLKRSLPLTLLRSNSVAGYYGGPDVGDFSAPGDSEVHATRSPTEIAQPRKKRVEEDEDEEGEGGYGFGAVRLEKEQCEDAVAGVAGIACGGFHTLMLARNRCVSS